MAILTIVSARNYCYIGSFNDTLSSSLAMDGKYSVYSVAESDPPKWEHHEDLVASGIVAVIFYLVIEVQVEIIRSFKQRKGLYFWSIQLGIIGVAADCIGISLKYLARDIKHEWPLETLFILGGWTVYATAQLLILYSRLHLVCRNERTQRAMKWMIIVTFICFQIPSWVCVWPGYADIPRISSVWSPRDAIVERFNQLGYTVAEAIISGVYIKCLLGLLKLKPSVRQRRVMHDLIWVNIMVVVLDVIENVLVWLNINALSHPIQTFSYALKLRLEFVILNQLMAVAARGLHRETFAERRYHPPTEDPYWGQPMRPAGSQPPHWSDKSKESGQVNLSKVESGGEVHIPLPQDRHPKSGSTGSVQVSIPSPSLQRDRTRSEPLSSHPEEASGWNKHADPSSERERKGLPRLPSNISSSVETELPIQSPAEHEDEDQNPRHSRFDPFRGWRNRAQRRKSGTSTDGEKVPMRARVKNHVPNQGRPSSMDDDEDEIALHMWERRGEIVLEVPWLKDARGVSTSSEV